MSRRPDVFTQLRLLETGGAQAVKSAVGIEEEFEEKVKLNPAQRKIRAARLQHEKAVKALLHRNEHARELAIAGVEALEQAETHDAETDEARRAREPEKKPSAADVAALAADSDGLAKTYKTAMAIEESGGDDRLKAWQLVYGVAQALLDRHAGKETTTPEIERAYRAQMTSLMRQSILMEEKGLIKHAIAALERLIDISPRIKADLATVKHLIAVSQRIVRLATLIGSVDRIRRFSVLSSGLSKKYTLPIPPATDPAVAAPPSKATEEEEDEAEDEAAGKEKPAAKPAPAMVPFPAKAAAAPAAAGAGGSKKKKKDKEANSSSSSSASSSSSSAPSSSSSASKPEEAAASTKKAEPAPAAAAAAKKDDKKEDKDGVPSWPVYEASDSSPKAQFARLLSPALFEGNFEPLKAAVGKFLLGGGDKAVGAMLRDGCIERFGITALMACAAGGQDRTLRDLLALYPHAEAPSVVIRQRDASGNNAIAHALNLNQQKALHELLLVAARDPKVQEAAPSATPSLLMPLSLLGLTVKHAMEAPAAAQQQLRAFCGQPLRYVAEYRPPIVVAAAPAATATAVPGAAAPFLLPPALAFAWAAAAQQRAAQLLAAAAQAAAATAGPAAPTPLPITAAAGAGASAAAASASAPTKATAKATTGAGAAAVVAPPKLPSNVSAAARDGKLAGRELKPFEFDGGAAAGGDDAALGGLGEEEGTSAKGKGGKGKGNNNNSKKGSASSAASAPKFDQFALNEEKFGVKASYKEELYTTKLDMSAFTPEQIARANALAEELDTEASAGGGEFADNPHMKEERGAAAAAAGADDEDEDEEAKFSAVARPAKGKGAKKAGDAFTDAGVAAAAVASGKKDGGKPQPSQPKKK